MSPELLKEIEDFEYDFDDFDYQNIPKKPVKRMKSLRIIEGSQMRKKERKVNINELRRRASAQISLFD